MDKESTTLELSRSLVTLRTREDTITITMEDILILGVVDITTMAIGMAMGMEEATVRTIPTP